MCGINGFVYKKNGIQLNNVLNEMNNVLNHRGPDDKGTFYQETDNFTIGFGHLRLSILDLSVRGHQPMFYEKQNGSNIINNKFDVVITFNGEIYNHDQLRNLLIEKGFSFYSKSDTEVILASYIYWGIDCVKYFNGMWSFAIFDKVKNQIFCSRDRLGKKPFYYYFDDEKFIFSSEIKSILCHNISKNIDTKSIDLYFNLGYIPSPYSIYKNIYKLGGSYNLIFDINNFNISNNKYMEIQKSKLEFDKKKLIEYGQYLIDDSVKLRMFNSDVPTGAFLSGGIDSSTIVGTMIKNIDKKNLHTFSIGFEGEYDETNFIDITKTHFGTNHHHKYFYKNDFEQIVDKIYYFFDEPFSDFSNFPTYFLSNFTKSFVSVALSGDGGDELFGGYLYHKIGNYSKYLFYYPKLFNKIFSKLLGFNKGMDSYFGLMYNFFQIGTNEKFQFYSKMFGENIYHSESFIEFSESNLKNLLELNDGDLVRSLIDYDLFYNTLQDNYLTKVDRCSMAFGLEVRCPFLDYRFIDYSRKIPPYMKLSLFGSKILLKEIVKNLLPDKILNRKKNGFTPPLINWINDEKFIKQIKEGIEFFNKNKLISKGFYEFCKSKVLKNDFITYKIYKIRIFLLILWYEKWIGKIG